MHNTEWNQRRKRPIGIVAIVAMVCFAVSSPVALPQDLSSNARSISMANSGVSTARGVDALGLNPGAIKLPKGKNVSIGLFPVGVYAGTDFLDMETYNKYFTGIDNGTGQRIGYYLDEADKQALLGKFDDGNGHFATNVSLSMFGSVVTTPIGSIAFGIRDRISATMTIPRDYAEVILFGNTPGKTFDFSETSFHAWWIRDYNLSLAHTFSLPFVKSFSAGVTAKLVRGFGYFGTKSFQGSLTTDPDSFVITGNANLLANYAGTEFFSQLDNPFAFQLFPEPVGHGLGFDIGFLAELYFGFTVGISVTDIGSITWDRNASEIRGVEKITLSDLTQSDVFSTIEDMVKDKETPISSFTTMLPTTLHIGASYSRGALVRGDDRIVLAASLRQGFNSMPGTSTTPRVSFGAEWELIPSVPLRGGVALGGYMTTAYAVGIGFHIEKFTLNIGTDNLGFILSNRASAASVAIGAHLDF